MEKLGSSSESSYPKIRRILGRVLPFIDPIVDKNIIFGCGQKPDLEERVRLSGRKTHHWLGVAPGAIFLPTVEFLPPEWGEYYGVDFNDPDAVSRFVATFETPRMPQVIDTSEKNR